MSQNAYNCWDVMKCEFHPGNGHDCPAFTTVEFDGVNGGDYAGRFCWAVHGTLCYGATQGSFGEKAMDCMKCQFYAQVVQEEGRDKVIINPDQLR